MCLTVILAACGTARSSDPSAATGTDAHFLAITLTDVRTGEGFTLGGFPGKVTFFIAMAVW